jgi:hypothetical protein
MLLKKKKIVGLLALLLLAGLVPAVQAAVGPLPDPTVAAGRETEPVVVQGSAFGEWAAPAELTVKVPSVAGASCTDGANDCSHNQYEQPEVTTGAALGEGVPTDKLLGYKWNGRSYEQIPLQVDEMAVRYLSNNASTFSVYSQVDQHLTYVYDQERFRWTKEDPADPCHAISDGPPSSPDTVPGLDANDEVSFMASDAGPEAPATATLPRGIASAKKIIVADPTGGGVQQFVYVMQTTDEVKAPRAKFNASNGYVRYQPDADSDTFFFSESSYESYGNTFKGAWTDPATGRCVTDQPKQHRPRDTAWVRTPRYSFRYDGRWLMTQLHVAPKTKSGKESLDAGKWSYGPDLIDEWKARAFQQRPGGDTPCCGYEEEVNNWGGSSILFGVKAGPVRVIRSTWGADSSTNNVRTEIFYRDEVRQLDNLRVHVIPPADGIYQQWDYNAGKITTYYNPWRPDGVTVDGKNDEVFGNAYVHEGSDGVRFRDDDPIPVVGPQDLSAGEPGEGCPDTPIDQGCISNDIDMADPTFGGINPGLNYEEVTGPFGTLVHRQSIKQVTGGSAYTLATIPYYRDDACFDDGTGTDPGPHVRARSVDPVNDSNGQPRECWDPSRGDPANARPADHYYQGDIGTHGVHIELIADSDNAAQTVPLTEISSETRIVVLPGQQGNVGERYGRGTEKPLVATVLPI